jgi:L-lactate dehydrogenase complex protein LldG
MAEFHKLLARVKTALVKPKAPAAHPDHAAAQVPVAPGAHKAELVSRFAHELEAVNGHFLGNLTLKQAAARIAAIARESGFRTAAIGEGVVTDMAPLAKALQGAGCEVIRTGPAPDGARNAMREQLARCDLGVAEASYAIASTGTFAVMTSVSRPNSLTLLPPASVIFAHIDRMVPDLATALAAIGPDALATHRLSLITGPSRTADIEKRIVLGVHGPKAVYGAIIWPDHE